MTWQIVLEIIGIVGGIATLLAFFLAPMFYLGSKMDTLKDEMQKVKDEVQKEMKDFHARLCIIEERNRK